MSDTPTRRVAVASIYLVTSGSYSDYGVNGVFSTREKAQAWIDAKKSRPSDPYEIEVHPLDDPGADAPDGAWRVVVNAAGVVVGGAEWLDGGDPHAPAIQVSWGRPFPPHGTFAGHGPTQEHARRSAEELRRATLAGTVAVEPVPKKRAKP